MKHRLSMMAAAVAVAAIAAWWVAAAPAAHHAVPDAIVFPDDATRAAEAVDRSEAFASALTTVAADNPGYDDVIFLQDGHTLLLSGMDGRIWAHDQRTGQSTVFVDPPLMAAGMHESPTDHDVVYFCASRLWGDTYPANERVGLYRLQVSTRQIEPVVLDVPDTAITGPRVWPLGDPAAPRLPGAQARPLAFCNDLEVSHDGERIYFTEPFAYAGASMGGGTVPEVLAYQGNGRIWLHDLASRETRLVAEGIHFPDGVLVDLHPGQPREESILVSQTTGFRLLRLFVSGPRAGTQQLVQDGMTGMCDGMDRDARGNIWCGMYTHRSGLLNWLHANPWAKQVLLRLPLHWIPQPKRTGVLVLSPDASTPLYSAWYQGEKLIHNASALPGPDGFVYLAPFSRTHRGVVRMPHPLTASAAQ